MAADKVIILGQQASGYEPAQVQLVSEVLAYDQDYRTQHDVPKDDLFVCFVVVSFYVFSELVQYEPQPATYDGKETEAVLDDKDLIVHYVCDSHI